MHPQVDIAPLPTPIATTGSRATLGSHAASPLARTLLNTEKPMRSTIAHQLTTLFTLLTLAAFAAGSTACMGATGEGRSKAGTGSGSGSGDERDDDESCEEIRKDISIRNVADMTALPKTGCYDIYGKLSIQGSGITSLAGLNQINSVDHLELDHTSLTAIDTPRPLGIYGELTVVGNAKLTKLDKLSFEIAPTAVKIDGNAALTGLEPFSLGDPKLERVDGDLAITGNAALAQIALPYLTTVTGRITISNNAAAKTLSFGKLATAGGLTIADHTQLTGITLATASEITGDLMIRNNALLANLGTLTALKRVTGTLTIDNNAALTSLSGFTGLRFVDQLLIITNNGKLTDLGALKRLLLIGALTVTNNQTLVVCRAIEVGQCVPQPFAPTIRGNRDIECSWQCN